MKGRLIVIEGLDGSGKNTQAKLLEESLRAAGCNVLKVSFPDYESQSSALVKMYLGGEFGSDPDSVNAYAASCFYAVDRFASYKTKWGSHYNSGGIVIADRYTTSNAVHQCAKLPEDHQEEYLRWLYEFEYSRIGIPQPDIVIYLRVDPDISQELMTKRYGGSEDKKDIHEKDIDYLRRSRISADKCASRLGWKTVECIADGQMRSIEDISGEVSEIVRNFMQNA